MCIATNQFALDGLWKGGGGNEKKERLLLLFLILAHLSRKVEIVAVIEGASVKKEN